MTVATYSQLWLAALTLQSEGNPLPRCARPNGARAPTGPPEPTTGELLRLLRYEYWASARCPAHFYHCETGTRPDPSAQQCTPDLPATLFCTA